MDKLFDLLKTKFPNSTMALTTDSSSLLNCEGVTHPDVPFLFRPQNREECIEFVKICHEQRRPYYVYSRGNNWGYGCRIPAAPNCIQLDLSRLNSISNFNQELGMVEIEPGVSQEMLYQHLQHSSWMIPTTGAGLEGSLVGNALDRGFGLNPISDHCSAIISMEVLLSDGSLLKSKLVEMGAHKSDAASKWKIGPYFEGLFSQSNLGVVLSVTLALAPRPQAVDLVMIKAKRSQLPELIKVIHSLRRNYQDLIGAINFSSKERGQATFSSDSNQKPSYFQKILEKIFRVELADWQAVVPLLTYDPHLKLHKAVLQQLKSCGLEVTLLQGTKLDFLYRIASRFKKWVPKPLFSAVEDIRHLKNLIKGIPNNFAITVAYHLKGSAPKKDPAHDGVGIFWFSPILRLTANDLIFVIETAKKTLAKWNRPNLFSFANFDQRLCEATIPIYFDPKIPGDREKALAAWEELYTLCLSEGFVPYRYSTLHMDKALHQRPKSVALEAQLKQIFDPYDLISPGRYSPRRYSEQLSPQALRKVS